MNQDHHSLTTTKKSKKIEIDFDEFQISEETFKPMTKGLGFHHETKKQAFKSAPKEVKNFAPAKSPVGLSQIGQKSQKISTSTSTIGQQTVHAAHVPSGLEAFYGQTKQTNNNLSQTKTSFLDKEVDLKEFKAPVKNLVVASMAAQFSAWLVDLGVIAAFVAITAALLVFASGIEYHMFSRIISREDLLIFTAAMFSIYYLLYFTILELGATPGKTIFGLKLVKSSGKNVAVKDSFFRAVISLVSAVALFLPLVLDFQGRLTDTKVVK